MGQVIILPETTKNPITLINGKRFKKGIPRSDLIGKKFGKLTVLEYLGGCNWMCVCDCGNNKIATTSNLKKSATVSCGCMTHERRRNASIRHGFYNHRLYRIWAGAKYRCTNPKSDSFKNYGARGIRMCNEWSNDYVAFHTWAMENGYSSELTLDRIDNDKGYSPDNCKWSTPKEQCRHGRNTRMVARLSMSGEVLAIYGSVAEAAEEVGAGTGSNIRRACNGEYLTAKGFKWKYAD